jgi:hypothetical protein
MSCKSSEVIIEAKILTALQHGSYEELLTTVDQAVSESVELFGDDAMLYATYSGRVVVANGNGQFFESQYKIADGNVVSFSDVQELNIRSSAQEMTSRAVQGFYEGQSLGLLGLTNVLGYSGSDPVQEAQANYDRLFSGGGLWRKHLADNKEVISRYGWDADYGTLEAFIEPLFGDVYREGSNADSEEYRESVNQNLSSLEMRLAKMLNLAKQAFERYRKKIDIAHDEESDGVLSQFEAFAEDYMAHLAEVGAAISEAVANGREGCVACSALAYDEVAKRMKNLELGRRFICKIEKEFARQ